MKKRIYMVLLVVCLCFFLQDKLNQLQEYLNDQMEQQFRNAGKDQLELGLLLGSEQDTRFHQVFGSLQHVCVCERQ